jgi:DNA-binding NarL/FixJ family response regulator
MASNGTTRVVIADDHPVVDAKSSKEIAVELGIKTVECHRTNLFPKLKVRSVELVVRYALRHGLVDL